MGIIVKLEDAHAIRYCNRGMRDFASRLGLNFESFRKHGIDSDQLPGENAMVQKLIRRAQERQSVEGSDGG